MSFSHPGGVTEPHSQEIFFLIRNTCLAKQLSQFVRERMLAMVLFLLRDVAVDRARRRRTDSERCISFLPSKASFKILLNPIRRILLQIPHQIGNAMYGTQTSQQ